MLNVWQPISTVPEGLRVLVYDPSTPTRPVIEAYAAPKGSYWDPTYDEWDTKGATHWMPLPNPPKPDEVQS